MVSAFWNLCKSPYCISCELYHLYKKFIRLLSRVLIDIYIFMFYTNICTQHIVGDIQHITI